MLVKCSSDEFTCQSQNQCIPSNAVCDGIHVNILFKKKKQTDFRSLYLGLC